MGPGIRTVLIAVALHAAVLPGEALGKHGASADALRLDHLQMVGTHNSYHRMPLVETDRRYSYEHGPLSAQLDAGIRSLELDVHYRGVPELLVYHSDPDDNQSSCTTLSLCLEEIAAWSDNHGKHHALFVMIEAKTGFDEFGRLGDAGTVAAEEQRQRALRDLEAGLRAVRVDRIVTPDEVRGGFDALGDAIRERGWPSVKSTRGRVVFFLLAPRAVANTYLTQYPGLRGARMFLLGRHHGAVASYDDPRSQADNIAGALARNVIVRTRADVDNVVDDERRRLALESGAHIVATDFPNALLEETEGSRCNPVTAPAWCNNAMVEPGRRRNRQRATSPPHDGQKREWRGPTASTGTAVYSRERSTANATVTWGAFLAS